jgi:transposase
MWGPGNAYNETGILRPLYRNTTGPNIAQERRLDPRQPRNPPQPEGRSDPEEIGAWFVFLPPNSPDLNPIEMAFARLKTLIRKAAARTYDHL